MMSSPTSLKYFFGPFTIILVFVFALAAGFAQAQTSPTGGDAPTADPTKEIAVAPNARDTQIADRLKSILDANGWFYPVIVSVR